MMKSTMPWFYLIAAAQACSVFADDGVDAYRQGHYVAAARELSSPAGKDPIIDYYIGRMHLYGYGQLKNNTIAIHYFKLAAERGFLPALHIMARYALLEEKNPEAALNWFKKAADLNDVSAQMYAAAAYQFGVGVKPNSDMAKRYYIAAARNGNSIAQCTLAQSFLETHQSANKKLGLIWLGKALAQNNPEAQVTMAKLYASGGLVPRDLVKAKELLTQAVAQGYVPALYQMGELARQENDLQSAKDWYIKAADAHYPLSEIALSNLYTQEKSPFYNLKEGFLWMLKSAQNGSYEAQVALSDMYKKGLGVDADENLAKEWQLKATQTGKSTPEKAQIKAATWLSDGKTTDFSAAGYRLHGIFSAWSNPGALKENNYNQPPQMDSLTRDKLYQPQFVMINPNQIPMNEYYDALVSSLAPASNDALIFPTYPLASEDLASQAKQLEGQAILGDASAQYTLAQLYQQGLGVTANIQEAVKYYKLAAAQQDLRAEYNLALLYLEGQGGISADPKKGFDLLQDAAFKGNSYAQYVLALIYEQGKKDSSGQLIIAPDHEQSMAMYGLAAANNLGLAQYRLAETLVREKTKALTLAEKKRRNQMIKGLYEGAVADHVEAAAMPLAFFNAMDTDPLKQQQAFAVAKKEAEAGNMNAALLLGLMYDSGISVPANPDDAVHWYEQAASSPIGAFLLGTHLSQGTGTSRNVEKGQALLQQAADAGFSYAHHNLAILQQQSAHEFLDELTKAYALGNATSGLLLADYYLSQANDDAQMKKAREIYQGIANAGDKNGQLKLAYMFEKGLGGDVDLANANKFYTLSAEQGDPVAQYLLGHLYQLGAHDQTPNYAEAKKWYSSAQSSYAPAAVALGFIYDTVDDDYKNALDGYERAALLGDVIGQFNAGLIYEEGKGIPVDLDKATAFYLKAAEAGHVQAMMQLAGIYLESSSNKQKAMSWYKKAAALGDRDALYQLGLLSETGVATKLDYPDALKYYEQASDKGNVTAKLALARMYQYGLGVAKDPKQAAAFYRQLAALGNGYAQYQLATFYYNKLADLDSPQEGRKLLQQAESNGNLEARQALLRIDARAQDKNPSVEPVLATEIAVIGDKPADLMYMDALNTWNRGDESSSRNILAQILTQYPDYVPAKHAYEQLSQRVVLGAVTS